jgi:hypothetical protein
VGGANGVVTHAFELFHPPLVGAINSGRAQGAIVVVYTAALHLQALAIELEAVVRVKGDGPDAKMKLDGLWRQATRADIKDGAVQRGAIQGPCLDIAQVELKLAENGTALRHGGIGVGGANGGATFVHHREVDVELRIAAPIVVQCHVGLGIFLKADK